METARRATANGLNGTVRERAADSRRMRRTRTTRKKTANPQLARQEEHDARASHVVAADTSPTSSCDGDVATAAGSPSSSMFVVAADTSFAVAKTVVVVGRSAVDASDPGCTFCVLVATVVATMVSPVSGERKRFQSENDSASKLAWGPDFDRLRTGAVELDSLPYFRLALPRKQHNTVHHDKPLAQAG